MNYDVLRERRKSLAITVERGGRVIIKAPLRLPEREIVFFIKSREDWIKRAVESQKERLCFDNFSKTEQEVLREKAKAVLPEKISYFSRLMGVKPAGIKINSAKKRFGSCNAKNGLNFSLFLMLYPDSAIDYVVVHELAHIKHKNHSKAFYKEIEKYLPDFREREKILKKL